MQIVPRTKIEIRERQRKERKTSDITDLKASILSKGLMHPPVVSLEDGIFALVAGETRLLAIDLIAADGGFFMCDGKPITPGEIPITLITDLSAADLFEAEFEENEYRKPLSWQDRARALAKLHELRLRTNPKQTFSATAQDLAAKMPNATGEARSPDKLRTTIRESVVLASHLDKPKIANARNHAEAMQLLLRDENTTLEAELIKRRLKAEPKHEDVIARHGDSLVLMPQMEANQFDLLIVDPPYGIKANEGGFRQRTMHHHNYEDTPEVARDLLQAIVQEGFRLCKPRANLFCFGDIDYFPLFKQMCAQMGWVPFRTPITWKKSNEGLAPWGSMGPRRCVEWIFFATKGQRGLLQSPTDWFDFKRVGRADREYGPEKPLDLIRFMLEISTMPGDSVFDPCCGSGVVLQAARQMRRKAVGIELDESAYKLAVVRAAKDDEGQQLNLSEALA